MLAVQIAVLATKQVPAAPVGVKVIVTASPGAMGGMRAAQQMQLLVNALFGVASPYMLIVPAVDKKFDAEGILIDEKFENTIRNFVTEYLWLAETLVENKCFAKAI